MGRSPASGSLRGGGHVVEKTQTPRRSCPWGDGVKVGCRLSGGQAGRPGPAGLHRHPGRRESGQRSSSGHCPPFYLCQAPAHL